MKTIFAVVILSILISSTSYAHKDHIIMVNADGTLEGLPAEYGPAKLNVGFASPTSTSATITSLDLQLCKNQVHVPLCVTGLLQTQRMSEIRAKSSWYHDEKTLPYYLHVDFNDPGYNESRWANPGYSLLFNLHTGKLMRMTITIARDNGTSIQEVPVDLAARCTADELKQFASPGR